MFSHDVDVSALSIFIVMRVFVEVFSMCLMYVSLGSKVNPNIVALMFMGSMVLSICSVSCVLLSSGSGVKRVHAVLSGLRMRLFVCVHVCMIEVCFGYVSVLCVDVMAMSSAYVVGLTDTSGVGVSDVYMLNSVGDMTPPSGTLVLDWRCVYVLFLNVVYDLCPFVM